jgi:MYXO-CTERM domain-containing protein
MKCLAVLLATASFAGVVGRPAPARACSFAGPAPYMIDASMQATDHVAPTLPPLSVARLQRGKANEGCSVDSCAGIGSLAIGGAATDDVTAAEDIGYRFSVVDGALPMSFAILLDQPSRATVADGKIWFNWDDGATADHEPINFTLQVVAIDKAGNESAPQTVRVSHDAGDGCAVAGEGPPRRLLAWFVGLALAGVLVARRRRPERIRGQQRRG